MLVLFTFHKLLNSDKPLIGELTQVNALEECFAKYIFRVFFQNHLGACAPLCVCCSTVWLVFFQFGFFHFHGISSPPIPQLKISGRCICLVHPLLLSRSTEASNSTGMSTFEHAIVSSKHQLLLTINHPKPATILCKYFYVSKLLCFPHVDSRHSRFPGYHHIPRVVFD